MLSLAKCKKDSVALNAMRACALQLCFSLAIIFAFSVASSSPFELLAQSADPNAKANQIEQSTEEEADEKPEDSEDEEAAELPIEGDDPLIDLVNDISENMHNIEDLLKNRDTSSGTQAKQKQTADLLDKLIEEITKRSSKSSSSSGSQSGSKPKSSDQQSNSKQNPGDQQKQSEQMKKQRAGQKKEEKKGGQKEKPTNQTKNNETSEGQMPEAKSGELRKQAAKANPWGRLPGKVIEKLYDNGNLELPSRYRHLLEEYFRRLPEQ